MDGEHHPIVRKWGKEQPHEIVKPMTDFVKYNVSCAVSREKVYYDHFFFGKILK